MKYTIIPPNEPPRALTAYARPMTLGEHQLAFMAARLHLPEPQEPEEKPPGAIFKGYHEPLIDNEYVCRRALLLSTHRIVIETMEVIRLDNAEILGNLERLKLAFKPLPGVIATHLRSVGITDSVFEVYLTEVSDTWCLDISEHLEMIVNWCGLRDRSASLEETMLASRQACSA